MAEPPMEHDAFDFNEREADWQVAGYLPVGESYKTGDDYGYINFDPESHDRHSDIPVSDWQGYDFLSGADYVTVHVWTEGDGYYVTLGGPFNDMDDLWDAIEDWWENGS